MKYQYWNHCLYIFHSHQLKQGIRNVWQLAALPEATVNLLFGVSASDCQSHCLNLSPM
jgi:hypothetical protein